MSFETFALDRLERLEQQHLRRRLGVQEWLEGPKLRSADGEGIQFASNDYLGLARDARLRQAAARALVEEGTGAGSARLVCGSRPSHRELERALAEFKGCSRTLTFSSGYAMALGIVPAVVGPGDVVILDRLAHACLVDGARLSRAKLRVFRHNDLADLEQILQWARSRRPAPAISDESGGTGGDPHSESLSRSAMTGRILIVTESVFSMDGDRAPLREIVALKERYGAWLLVDEAHATGVIGPGGRGLISELGLEGKVEIPIGTMGKALGAAGGFVGGSEAGIDYFVQRARSFVFSTAPPPPVVAAATAALSVLRSDEGRARISTLHARVQQLHAGLADAGWRLPAPVSPVVPFEVGEELAVLRLAEELRAEGYWVPAIRYPTVPRGRARLRITVSAVHSPEDVSGLVSALSRATRRIGLSSSARARAKSG